MPLTLVEVTAALGDVRIRERFIASERTRGPTPRGLWMLGQYCYDSGVVEINEAAHLVPTLVHELIHRVRPEWSERSVLRAERALVRKMTDTDAMAIYEEYLKRKDVAR